MIFKSSLFRSNNIRKVGWIIGGQLEESKYYYRINFKYGGLPVARFRWVADVVNTSNAHGLKYEVYRPWKKYDALIFLKSMGEKSMRLLNRYRDKGLPIIFDANVNYYESEGEERYTGMLPTQKQEEDAIEITRAADAVIADSQFIAQKCNPYNKVVQWLPDAVRMDAVPSYTPTARKNNRMRLLWSGEAVKLFELLAIEDILLKYSDEIELLLITNSLDALDRWRPEYKARFYALMKRLQHKVIPFDSMDHMFDVYAEGGIFISPRYMDNTYNQGHTEWKIALAMACGRISLCSPVPSYKTLFERANKKGIRICHNELEWDEALDSLLSNKIDIKEEERVAKSVIEKYYSSEIVAKAHADFVSEVMS